MYELIVTGFYGAVATYFAIVLVCEAIKLYDALRARSARKAVFAVALAAFSLWLMVKGGSYWIAAEGSVVSKVVALSVMYAALSSFVSSIVEDIWPEMGPDLWAG